ncbi:major capsid protein [Brevibacterium sp. K72]|uniref:major capsid protein n=1 Tax=Brevibacterium sp. K72 TaxID=3390729 RepID=UPI003D301436
MPVTLVEAKNNTQEDYDPAVIDEFRKESSILDSLIFDDAVNPAGGGATLTYGYRRLKTQATAATRPLNTEYTPGSVETSHHSTELAVLGGSFEVDRVIASLGPAASAAVALNMGQKIKAAVTKFQDLVINGDTATDAAGFDGLDKALVGSSTEINGNADWTDFDTNPRAEHKALDLIDEFLMSLDGTPTVILGNKRAMARLRAAARRAGEYVKNPVEDLVGQDGRPIVRETYGGILFADPGAKPGTNDPIIPIAADGTTDIYAYRVGLDGFHGVTTVGSQMVRTWLPDFTSSGAVKKGEVELGPASVALKATKAAAVLRGIKVKAV